MFRPPSRVRAAHCALPPCHGIASPPTLSEGDMILVDRSRQRGQLGYSAGTRQAHHPIPRGISMRTRSPLRHAPLALAAAALVASACAERITDSGVTPAGPNAPRMSVIPSTPYVAIEGGQSHACGLDGSGQLHCWGRNPLGQL